MVRLSIFLVSALSSTECTNPLLVDQIATGYIQNGAKVYISSRTPAALKETADKLNKLGKGKCIPIVADLSKWVWKCSGVEQVR